MPKKVLALHCHPDDIEFMMAGTLFLLKDAGFEIHYMNMANGCYGSAVYSKDKAAVVRRDEAIQAARFLGADFHESITDDLGVYYTPDLIRKTLSIIRTVAPDIVLLPSPEEYMEDHMNTCRVGVTAAFCRAMPSLQSIPDVAPVGNDLTIYHAMPYGLTDGMRNKIIPDFYIDIESVIEKKRTMLGYHKSQKEWLDESQGIDSYLDTMQEMSASMGSNSKTFNFAEGWRRHSHIGFSANEMKPLEEILSKKIAILPDNNKA